VQRDEGAPAPAQTQRRARRTIESGGGAEPRSASGDGKPAQDEGKPMRRDQPKVGRNDPCPCGSGKKYKKCHGAVARPDRSNAALGLRSLGRSWLLAGCQAASRQRLPDHAPAGDSGDDAAGAAHQRSHRPRRLRVRGLRLRRHGGALGDDRRDGTVGAEQSYPLPPARPSALRGSPARQRRATPSSSASSSPPRTAPTPSFASSPRRPTDRLAPAPGPPVTTFGGARIRSASPDRAWAPRPAACTPGAAWLDYQTGFPTYAFIDGQGRWSAGAAHDHDDGRVLLQLLGFAPGKQELTVTYQHGPTTPGAPTWMIADVTVDGAVTPSTSTWPSRRDDELRPTGLYDNGGSPEYAIIWQDTSGSWLSVYYGAQTGQVKSFGFASSTDFGGPDLQPPLSGFAPSGRFRRPVREGPLGRALAGRPGRHAQGGRSCSRPAGNIAGVSSVASPGLLTSTYADLTGPGRAGGS
jgi:hypothetical protein